MFFFYCRVLEEELKSAKDVQTEQSKRMAAAEVERERIQKLSGDVKSALWHQLQLVEKYSSEVRTPDEKYPYSVHFLCLVGIFTERDKS